MTVPNPYQSPSDVDCRLTTRRRAGVTVLTLVLLNAVYSAFKIVRNLPELWSAPDSTPVLIGVAAVFWLAWIAVELVAALLIWRGRAAGRWMLVASFGLRGVWQVGVWALAWPLLVRTPSLALAAPWLFYEIHAVVYCGVALWLLFFSPFENRAV